MKPSGRLAKRKVRMRNVFQRKRPISRSNNVPNVPILKAPVLKTPVLKTPILKTPILKAPVLLKTPVLKAPAPLYSFGF